MDAWCPLLLQLLKLRLQAATEHSVETASHTHTHKKGTTGIPKFPIFIPRTKDLRRFPTTPLSPTAFAGKTSFDFILLMSAAETVLSPQPGGGNLSVVRARANDVLLKIHRLTENVRQLETATALDASATQQQHQDVLNALEVVGVEMRALADASRPALRHWTAHPVLIQSEADANNLPWLLSTNPLPGTESAVDGAAAADVSAAYEATSARIDAINTAVDSLLARGGPLDPSGPCRERAGLAGTGRR